MIMKESTSVETEDITLRGIDACATGRRVYHLLSERGYNVREAARILGCSEPQAVYNWKYGTRMPSIDNLDRLSCLLDISINELLVHYSDDARTCPYKT